MAKPSKTPQKDDSLNLPGIYGQLAMQCTVEQIETLIDRAKSHSKVAAKNILKPNNKKELLGYLKLAVDSKFLAFEKLIEVLRDSEECGRQTIFLFKPKNASVAAKLKSPNTIAEMLFGEVATADLFPIFERPKNGMRWVDFRHGLAKRPNDWLLKAYGHEEDEITIKRDRKSINESERTFRETRDLKVRDIDTTMVVRWRHPDFLEIRVDKKLSSGFAEMLERLNPIKRLLLPAINVDTELVAYSLEPASTKLLKNRNNQEDPKKPCYIIGTTRLLGIGEGSVDFRPFKADDAIDKEVGFAASVKSLLNEGAKAARVAIKWLGEESCPKSFSPPLLVEVDGDSSNALSVRSRVNPEVLEYVFDKLRSNN